MDYELAKKLTEADECRPHEFRLEILIEFKVRIAVIVGLTADTLGVLEQIEQISDVIVAGDVVIHIVRYGANKVMVVNHLIHAKVLVLGDRTSTDLKNSTTGH